MPFAIGIEYTKTEHNVGTLLRSAHNFGAAMVFTVGRRYRRQASDTENAVRKLPVLHFSSWEEFRDHAPIDWVPIAVELGADAVPLVNYQHPRNALYILGPEDGSVSREVRGWCRETLYIPCSSCLNVATAGSIVMYDRTAKQQRVALERVLARDQNIARRL